jgi:hypothetical protein
MALAASHGPGPLEPVETPGQQGLPVLGPQGGKAQTFN